MQMRLGQILEGIPLAHETTRVKSVILFLHGGGKQETGLIVLFNTVSWLGKVGG